MSLLKVFAVVMKALEKNISEAINIEIMTKAKRSSNMV
jgi:hypothetical protein